MTSKLQHTTSLADALFSGTRQKVLGLLFTHPGEDFSIGELIERAGAGSGAVQREISRLTESGLVCVDRKHRQKRYRANPHSPVYPELCALIRKTLGPAPCIQTALDCLGDDIELALLYGSVARNTDHAGSDIDLMLVSDTLTLEEVFSVLADVESELSRPINPTLYTRREFEQRRASNNPFLKKVLNGQYLLLKGSLDESGGA